MCDYIKFRLKTTFIDFLQLYIVRTPNKAICIRCVQRIQAIVSGFLYAYRVYLRVQLNKLIHISRRQSAERTVAAELAAETTKATETTTTTAKSAFFLA